MFMIFRLWVTGCSFMYYKTKLTIIFFFILSKFTYIYNCVIITYMYLFLLYFVANFKS